ncbi:hypothetical protein OAN59_03220 [Alphaproteobacteria bacterium]|nr:hypothetical protein [Alphaproteobacteria bacterium]
MHNAIEKLITQNSINEVSLLAGCLKGLQPSLLWTSICLIVISFTTPLLAKTNDIYCYHYWDAAGVLDDGDVKNGMRLLKEDSHRGCDLSINVLALLYYFGEIENFPKIKIEKDFVRAVKWLRLKSVFWPTDTSGPSGQYLLSEMYRTGNGVLKDLILSHMWANIASAGGNEDARNLRDHIEKEMRYEDISIATRKAKTCLERLKKLNNQYFKKINGKKAPFLEFVGCN